MPILTQVDEVLTTSRQALLGTVPAKATAGTNRLRLFKVVAMLAVSVRRVHVRMAGAFPRQELFRQAGVRLGSG